MKKNNVKVLILSVFIISMVLGLSAQKKMQKAIISKQIPKRPDLAIRRIDIIRGKRVCTMSIVIKNAGPGNLPDAVYNPGNPLQVYIYTQIEYMDNSGTGKTINLRFFDKNQKLKPVGGKIIYRTDTFSYRSRIKLFKITIDPQNRLLEANEKNNEKILRNLKCIQPKAKLKK